MQFLEINFVPTQCFRQSKGSNVAEAMEIGWGKPKKAWGGDWVGEKGIWGPGGDVRNIFNVQ